MTHENLPALQVPDLAGKLRERIRDTLGTLIPDEHWQKMMEAEVDRFLKEAEKDHWGNYKTSRSCSDFTAIAQTEISAWVKAKVQKYLDSDEKWKIRWDSGELPLRLEEQIEKNLPFLLRETALGVLSGFAQWSRSSIMLELEKRKTDPSH